MQLISPDFKEDCYDIFYSFKEAIVRFFNNRFVTTNETIEFLKMELSKERLEKQKLQDYILELNSPKIDVGGTEEFKPIVSHTPFTVIRKNLEQKDREAARQRQINKEMESNKDKSTEELEQELLG